MVPCEAHCLLVKIVPLRAPPGKVGIGDHQERGPLGPFSFAYTSLARLNTALAGSYEASS